MRRIKKAILWLLIIGIFVGGSILVIDSYIRISVKDRILEAEELNEFQADCVFVLGAGLSSRGRPGKMLQDRILKGIEIYEMGVSDRLLMSGDHGRTEYDEVNAMKEFAISEDIPSSHIFMDHAGLSTYESLYRARDVFQVKKIVIVSQEYHLYRALYIADKLGIEAVGISASEVKYVGYQYRESREVLARVKDFIYVILKPEPTYLGAQIPIEGDGDLTND